MATRIWKWRLMVLEESVFWQRPECSAQVFISLLSALRSTPKQRLLERYHPICPNVAVVDVLYPVF